MPVHLLSLLLATSLTVEPTLTAPPIIGLTAGDLHDTFDQTRGKGRHEAIDIMEPRGTPVHAVVDGTIAKLFLSKPGGNTIYLFDQAGEFCYYYAHLDRYAPNLREGMHVSRGEVVAFVGSTGNASPEAPHLHFTIFQLGPEKKWWKGTPVDPYPFLLHLLKMGANGIPQ
ncbi:MAG TPA: M23 family metallopeptidase [Bryobacteraceae bacterium]|nr:M23 family metallopeptidase [Bryobacteraceae bacterium]